MTTQIELKPTSTPLSAAEREALVALPGFGQVFTEHMVTIRYTEGRGWHDARCGACACALMLAATGSWRCSAAIGSGSGLPAPNH